MSLELESMYCLDPENVSGKRMSDAWTCKKGFADVLRVQDQTTIGTHNLLHKQLRCIGAPTWTDCVETEYEYDGRVPLLMEPGIHSVRSFLYTSDGGPDEGRFKKLLYVLTASCFHILIFTGICFMHATQLWVRSGLSIMDKWCKTHHPQSKMRYFAVLSKISQIWGDNATAIFRLVQESQLGGPVAAVNHARSAISRCIAGRCQSSHATEKRLMQIGGPLLTEVLNDLFADKKRARAKSAAAIAADAPGRPIDDASEARAHTAVEDLDPMTETVDEHRNRMSRWRMDVSRSVNDVVFWILVRIHFLVNEVVDHFIIFLGTAFSDAELQDNGNQLFRLANGKGRLILAEFENLLRDPTPFDLLSEPVIQMASDHETYGGMVSPLAGLVVLLVTHHAVNFEIRVLRHVLEWPRKFVLFTARRPEQSCAVRQGFGTETICQTEYSYVFHCNQLGQVPGQRSRRSVLAPNNQQLQL